MSRLSILPVIARELLASRPFPRELEPDLVMDDPDQVAAYSEAGRIDGIMSAAYLFHSARASQAIAGAREVLDLGCGPATQLVQIAELNPQTHFVGVDLSESMLESAEAYARARGVRNVSFRQQDITALADFDSHRFDAVISTMVFHHLPSTSLLEACFREISRVLRPQGAIYLTDFSRLNTLRSVLYFAYKNAANQPHLFSLDYERSLRAAFHLADFRSAITALPADVRLVSTYLVPMLVVMQTPPRVLPAGTQARLQQMRRELPRRYRSDLEEMRLFLKLGGMRDDPFSTNGRHSAEAARERIHPPSAGSPARTAD